MDDRHIAIKNWLQKHRLRGVNLLQRLVQEGSVRGKEARAQAIIIEKCRELGLVLDIWEIGDEQLGQHPAYCSDRKDFSGNPNVVAILKGGGQGKSIILNGHIDVVPVNDPTNWEDDPFSGKIENGRMYGRGTTDMKGGTVSLLLALEAIIASDIPLDGDVIFQSVIEEESGGAGTLAAVLRGYEADGAIIPEPTDMKLFPKQQGSMWFRLHVKGKSAHGGTRYEGVSAIEKSLLVMKQLQQLETVRNSRIHDPLYDKIPIPIPINIGKLHSGDWPSSVPDLCIMEGRIGVAPNESIADVKREFQEAIDQLETIDSWFRENPVAVEWFGGRWMPGMMDDDHPLLLTLKDTYQAVTGNEPVLEASPWGTDGGILSKVGHTPVIVFGPGVTAVAHDANEYIELEKVFMAAEIIALTILAWCSTNKAE